MKKLKFKKFKKRSNKNKKSTPFKFKRLLQDSISYTFLLGITIIFATIAFIALPETEKFLPNVNFDLSEKSYISKSYILELKIQKKDKDKIDEKVKQTSRILSKRLYKAGAQQVSITGYHSNSVTPDDEDYFYRYIQVNVKAAISEKSLDQLVGSRNYLRFYTAKEDVDFDDEENPYAQYMVENYEPSKFTRDSFRNIFLTKSDNSDSETVYSAIFKSYPFNKDFENFISNNAGQKIGFGIDKFITPIDIPFEYNKEYRKSIKQNHFMFAINLTGDKSTAKLYSILFNSGVIPLEFSISDQSIIDTPTINISHLYLALTYLVIVVALALFNIIITKKEKPKVAINVFSLLMTFAIYIAYLKFLLIPIDLSLLYVTSILFLLIAYINTLKSYDNNDYLITLLILFITWIFSFGIIKELSLSLLTLLTLYIITKDLVRLYIINIKKFLSND